MVCGLLTAVVSLAAERRCEGVQASEVQRTGSVVVLHRLSCSTVCGIFLDEGSNLSLLRWQVDSLPPSYWGSPGH